MTSLTWHIFCRYSIADGKATFLTVRNASCTAANDSIDCIQNRAREESCLHTLSCSVKDVSRTIKGCITDLFSEVWPSALYKEHSSLRALQSCLKAFRTPSTSLHAETRSEMGNGGPEQTEARKSPGRSLQI